MVGSDPQFEQRRPGARVLRTSGVDAHHHLARFAWHVVLADGRIRRIIGFFGPLT